jgi:hypothetical protein
MNNTLEVCFEVHRKLHYRLQHLNPSVCKSISDHVSHYHKDIASNQL